MYHAGLSVQFVAHLGLPEFRLNYLYLSSFTGMYFDGWYDGYLLSFILISSDVKNIKIILNALNLD